MELKKSPKADLENKKGIFSLLGLAISLLLMIGMFSWGKQEIEFEQLETEEIIIENEVMEITREEPPKIEQPKVVAPVVTDMLEVVKDDIDLGDDVVSFDTEFTEDTQINIEIPEEEEEEIAEDVPILIAEKMPTFRGGDTNKFRTWVQTKVVYPAIAEENNISGRVTCSFVVERDGTVSAIEVLNSPDKSLSDECIRVIKQSPKWTPGEQRGKAVRVKVIIPVMFTFGG